VTLTLEDEADISRGDMIAAVDAPPRKATRLEATLVWMQSKPLRPGATYLLKHTTQTVRARVVEIRSRLDVEHLQHGPADALDLNAIGTVLLETTRPLLADLYRENRSTGSFILMDPADHATAGAGMIREIAEGARRTHGHGALIAIGNSAFAAELEEHLLDAGVLVVRTRVSERERLIALAHAGAVVIAEAGAGELRITVADHGAEKMLDVPANAAGDIILHALRAAGVIPSEETGEIVQ
jgi:sulfate adenylyltransferase subunit 1